ncbi:Uncharacterized protein PCOAH_00052400 [Plasmodium coatneyi]|uniref:WD repeat-containing protein 82 n=1 Tax=Plasmodium coatneyi TaxID=208452 RepID=A0A1B1E7G2_9APIC|nr:Uncharacterized protein PCOAH_00052400 [Plasmodium coatneyi]ANQ10923.1 Uncharacterized protein PCOAH_00052400 [Plasmodium coatneyi]
MMNPVAQKKIKLTDEAVKSFQVLRAFKYKQALTKNMSWSYDGNLLLTSNQNDSITLYSLLKGNNVKSLHSKNCGVDVVRFLNSTNEVIVCSTKSNNSEHKQFLRFWDIKENKYIKSLPQIGNICEYNGINISENKKLMLINSDDGHVKLYYFNCDSPLILYKSDFVRPVSSFDQEGNIFIASYGKKEIHYYDLLMLDRGEYHICNLKDNMGKDEFVVNLLFTPNNKAIIVSTNQNNHFKIDSINGNFLCSYKYPQKSPEQFSSFYSPASHLHTKKKKKISSNSSVNVCDQLRATGSSGLEAPSENSCSSLFLPTVTPDGQYVMSGWTDSGIHIWNENGNYVTTLYGHEGPPYNVTFNPKCAVLASSCLNVALWQPNI